MTATPKNDCGNCNEASLLRDIWRSSSLKAGAGCPEDELMRAACDPLLVSRLLLERQAGDDARGVMVGWRQAAVPVVTVHSPGKGGLIPRVSRAASCRYEAPSGRLEPSLSPSVFAPAPEDRDAALDLTVLPLTIHTRSTRRLFWLGLGGVLVLGATLLRG